MVGGGDLAAQTIVAGDEFGEELVQARLEDGAHVAIDQQAAGLACQRLATVAVAIETAELVERRLDLLVAGMQRARHLPVEDQVVGYLPGLVAVLVDPAIAAVRGNRA